MARTHLCGACAWGASSHGTASGHSQRNKGTTPLKGRGAAHTAADLSVVGAPEAQELVSLGPTHALPGHPST